MTDHMRHPHFDYVDDTATVCYRSKATGQHYILQQDGELVQAIPATPQGTVIDVPSIPYVWADDMWDVLDAIHAKR